MKPIFEYSDTLNQPYEAFLFDAQESSVFPILPHWHYFMEIIYMLEGNAYIEAGDENYVLEPGDLIVFYPQMPHGIYSTGQFPLRYSVLKFDPAHLNIPGSSLPPISGLLAMAGEDKNLSIVFPKEKLDHEKLKRLFKNSIEAVTEKRFGYDIELHSNYCLIMTELFRIWEEEGFQIHQKAKEPSLNEKFAEVSEYISRHYQEPVAVEEIAQQMNMSYSYFASKFKEYYGQTCKQMIQNVRLQKAEDLLRFTEFDLSYISQETGFSDCSHLIRMFKERYGITPKQFRKNLR